MRATNWEFSNRAFIFGMVFAFSFPLYAVDHQNSAAALSHFLSTKLALNEDLLARFLLALGAALVAVAAGIRTWASSYLHANVVYASEVKTASLVADGPYRRVRNPLYLANILMVLGVAPMMSRLGFVIAVAAMIIFCYRLILREEAELQLTQGESYNQYRTAVPRLWPSPSPRVPTAGGKADWSAGFKAELWYWGIACAAASFAVTLNIKIFFVMLAASIALFWVSSLAIQKKPTS